MALYAWLVNYRVLGFKYEEVKVASCAELAWDMCRWPRQKNSRLKKVTLLRQTHADFIPDDSFGIAYVAETHRIHKQVMLSGELVLCDDDDCERLRDALWPENPV